MKRHVDCSNLELIDSCPDYYGGKINVYLLSKKVVGDEKVLTTTVSEWPDGSQRVYTKTEKLHYCVNGPLKGQKMTEKQGNQNGYKVYNASDRKYDRTTILVYFD